MSLFKTNPENLESLLKNVENAKIQLPDFQRGWVWDEERIKNLLISIVKQFPIGAIMMLDADDNAKFASVTLTGVTKTSNAQMLLLDGQQRLTSLFQALKNPNHVQTCDIRKKPLNRYFYFNIDAIIQEDIDEDEAIVIVNEKKQIRNSGISAGYDYTSREKECEAGLFPTNLAFDLAEMNNWGIAYTNNQTDIERNQKWNTFYVKMIEMRNYNIPVISLSKDNKKEAICSVFENVNTGGVPLNVFELLTATFAADGFKLRQLWEDEISKKLKDNQQDYNKVLYNVSNVDFLQSLTLLATKHKPNQAVACKRKHILDLTLEEFKQFYNDITDGYIEAARFLLMQRIYTYKLLPYNTQLIPMAAFFAYLKDEARTTKSFKKIALWYWNGVFGELYGGANETRYVKDFTEMINWIKDDNSEQPDTIKVSTFRANRLDEMRSKNSAAYKGIAALLLKNGALDFSQGYTIDNITCFNSSNIDIHHIFPKKYCENQGIPKEKYDSIINKTAIDYNTNRSIGGVAPSKYLNKLDETNTLEATNNALTSHLIDQILIRADNFDDYFADRKMKLIKLIEKETEKNVI